MRALCMDGSGGWSETDDLEAAAGACRQEGRFTWLEVDVGTGQQEAREVAQRFELDPLAVEDALSTRQRPKLETYDEHRFLVLYQLDEVDEQLEGRQIAGFVGDAFLLLLHDGATRMVDESRQRLQKVDPADVDVERALHALIDAVVDDYEHTAARLDADVEDLEAQALRVSRRGQREPARTAEALPSQPLLYSIKQQVSMLRRYAMPLSAVVEILQAEEESRRRSDGDDEDRTDLLFRDVHDHVLRLAAQVRNIDDLATAVIDLTRGVQADLLNEVNKKLSAWAAIIAIPTLIASVYGTNYQLWPPPDVRTWGFVGVVLIMAGAAAGLWMFFKRKRWI